MHLYWLIEDVPGQQGHAFLQAVAGGLISTLKRWMKKYETVAKLDAGVSTDVQSVMRLPGTYNKFYSHMCRIVLDHIQAILEHIRNGCG